MPGVRPSRSSVPVVFVAIVAVAAATVLVVDRAKEPASSLRLKHPESRMADVSRRLPMTFEENRGQADLAARYLARGSGFTAFFTRGGTWFSLPPEAPEVGPPTPTGAAVRMHVVGGRRVEPQGRERLEGATNYFLGEDPADWQRGVPTFGLVRYPEVLPGIDLRYRSGPAGELEYDLVLAPGSAPGTVALRFDGAEGLRLNEGGDLVISTVAGDLLQRAPVAYQPSARGRIEVSASFRIEDGRVAFAVGPHDAALPLVIDPVTDLAYSTLFGSLSYDAGYSIAVEGKAVYVAGVAYGGDLPTTAGAYDATSNGGLTDAFVAKFDPSGAAGADLVYSTFLGGDQEDFAHGIDVEGGAAFITGRTENGSTDLPTTPGAYDTVQSGNVDGFVAKIVPAGGGATDLAYSTFLGGTGDDIGNAIAVDAGTAYVTGVTADAGTDLQATTGAFSTSHNGTKDAFMAKIVPAGNGASDLAYCTFLGGATEDEGRGIAVDAGVAYVTGDAEDGAPAFPTTPGALDGSNNGGVSDAFASKIVPTGGGVTDLAYSTFLGGSAEDAGHAIAFEGGSMYITGMSQNGMAADLPTTTGAYEGTHNGLVDAFVSKIAPAGGGLADLQYSTYLGGSGDDSGNGISVEAGVAHVTGFTDDATTDFPTTPGAYDETHNGGDTQSTALDVFVAQVVPAGGGIADLAYSTFLGGGGDDYGEGIATDGGIVYVTGSAGPQAPPFPTTPGAYAPVQNGSSHDVFVALLITPGTCRGKLASLTGTAGANRLVGTKGADIIVGADGNDTIKGLGGADLICAGGGNDKVNGGGGKDRINGEGGKDRLNGGGGSDKLNGGSGKDRCVGASGNDKAPKCETEKGIP